MGESPKLRIPKKKTRLGRVVVCLLSAAAVTPTMAEVDDEVKAYFKKYSTEAEPSEHFPLMELPAYDCEEKVRSHDGGTLER